MIFAVRQKGKQMHEIYRLRLDHYMAYDEDRYQIEEPLVVQIAFDRRFDQTPYCLNRLLDLMRSEVLKRTQCE